MSQPYNILLILCDQMRGDCLGIAGHPDVKTPWLDTLAMTGVRYTNAYTACPSCIASRAGLLTGMRPDNHGRTGYEDGVAWRYAHTLPGELTKAGYQTECVGKMHVHPLRNSLGFQHIELHDGYLHYYRNPERYYYEDQRIADDYFHWLKQELGADIDVTDTGLDCNSWLARPWPYEERFHPTNWVTDRSLDFLRRRDRDKPFFLTVSYVRPHPPLDAPQAFFDMYKDKDLAPSPIGDWADSATYLTNGRHAWSDTAPADPEMLRQMKVGYYACITHMDNQIGRIYMELVQEHLLDNTIIIFASDHGELLGDHNLSRKSLPYEGSAHVPLILTGPADYLQERRGTVSNRLSELRDIMPTLLEAAGAPVPDTVDGISLLKEGAPWIHGEHACGKMSNQYIVTATDKYIWFSQTGEEQYFDLQNDPQELHNAIADEAAQKRIEELRSHLIRSLTGREEGYVQNGHLITGRTPQGTLRFLH